MGRSIEYVLQMLLKKQNNCGLLYQIKREMRKISPAKIDKNYTAHY